MSKKICVIGGGGYLGSNLVPKLLSEEYEVVVIDLFIFGNTLVEHKNLKNYIVDIRNIEELKNIFLNEKIDTVIHLACISNDPSFELNPKLGKSINFDCFEPLLKILKGRISRFIYASSSSVYGIKSIENVNEDEKHEPLTDYSKFKSQCEKILLNYSESFDCSIVRSATLCGYSNRLRLDLIVNILTNHAFHKGKISIFGGNQLRPNIHIDDLSDFYLLLISSKRSQIHKEAFNVGNVNYSVKELSEIVSSCFDNKLKIETIPTNDNRSYHISSKKAEDLLGFNCKRPIKKAVMDLKKKFEEKILIQPLDNQNYFNIERMKNYNFKYEK